MYTSWGTSPRQVDMIIVSYLELAIIAGTPFINMV